MKLNQCELAEVVDNTSETFESSNVSSELNPFVKNTSPRKDNHQANQPQIECRVDEKPPPVKLMDYSHLAAKYKMKSSTKSNIKVEIAPTRRKTGRITVTASRKPNVEGTASADKVLSPKSSNSHVNGMQQANLNSFLQIKEVALEEDAKLDAKPPSPKKFDNSLSNSKDCKENKSCDLNQTGSFKVSNNLFMSPRSKIKIQKADTIGCKLTIHFDEAVEDDEGTKESQKSKGSEVPANATVAAVEDDAKPLATFIVDEDSVEKCDALKENQLANDKDVKTSPKPNAFHFLMDRSKAIVPSEKSTPKEGKTGTGTKKRKLEVPEEENDKKTKRKRGSRSQVKKVDLIVDEEPCVDVCVVENEDCKHDLDIEKSPKTNKNEDAAQNDVESKTKPRKQKIMPPTIFKLKRNSIEVDKKSNLDGNITTVDVEAKTSTDSTGLRRSLRARKSIMDLSSLVDHDLKNAGSPKNMCSRKRLTSESSLDSCASSKSGKRGRVRPKKSTHNGNDIEHKVAPVTSRRSARNSVSSVDSVSSTNSSKSTGGRGRPKKSAKNGIVHKIAPVFNKAKPKPKVTLSPASIAARDNFLRSGVPNVLKKKQQKVEEARPVEEEFFTFPSIAHVQQRCDSTMWSLPPANIPLLEQEDVIPKSGASGASFASFFNVSPENNETKITFAPLTKGVSLYACFQSILEEKPNYPVRHCFVTFGDYNGLNYRPQKPQKLGPKSKQKVSLSKMITQGEPQVVAENRNQHTMWTKKYRPRLAVELLGNASGVKMLKAWLKSWLNVVGGPSGEMFDADGALQLKTAMILFGSHGCGKTATVYALCAELGVNVLEVNISSRRTGKQLLLQIQEATQSHQVRQRNKREARMCLLLIDDADLVYQQDEHFTRELSALICSSKRPIILTTNDYTVPHVMKYVNQQYPLLSFAGLSAHSMATYLQIVCLMEGVCVEHTAVGRLLEWNEGDMRRTLLQLQFWGASGGDRVDAHRGENKCVQAFISHPTERMLPEPLDLGQLWWNVPMITGADGDSSETSTLNNEMSRKRSEMKELKNYAGLMDAISFCDCLNHTERMPVGLEPDDNNLELVDTIELNPRTEEFETDRYLTLELQQCLLEWQCNTFSTRSNCTVSSLWSYTPPAKVRRWRGKQQNAATEFKNAMQVKCDRKTFAAEYFPYVRELARVEEVRKENSPRRGNRGFNILGTAGIYDIPPSDVKTACNIFQVPPYY